jgi:glycerate kinase
MNPMRVVIAPNSFKHCLSARAAGAAMARGVQAAWPGATVEVIPLSDGGDGLLDAVRASLPGELLSVRTRDALGRPVQAAWFKHRDFALIEMALASGLARLRGPREYAPLRASTFGTGLLIRAALAHGCRRVIIGLGGSATVDAGCGLAAALGFRLLDGRGRAIPAGGGGLGRLERIVDARAGPKASAATRRAKSRLKLATFIALCDVRNPLLGPTGAARVFGPQKGATPREVELLERNLAHWAAVVERDLGKAVAAIPGAGAAGGLGAGCVAFLGASLMPGAQWVAERTGLRAAIRKADLVLTGEGRLDRQTAFGKAPAYVAGLAQSLNKPVIALGGAVEAGLDLTAIGITRCVAIAAPDLPLAVALKNAQTNLEKKAADVILSFKR